MDETAMTREDERSKAVLIAAGVLFLLCVSGSLICPIAAPSVWGGEEALPWVTPSVQGDRIRYQTFWSDQVGQLVSYHIFVPVPYDEMLERRFPVLYWLHGSGGGLDGIRPLAWRFARAMQAGMMPAMLVVFPNGLELSMWADAKDGSVPMETVLILELLPHIDRTYRTNPSRNGRILEGFSMGGYGAARLGFKHYDLFSRVSILAGGPLQEEFDESPRTNPERREEVFRDVYGADMAYYRALSPWVLAEENARSLAESTRIRLVIGEADAMLEVNQRFHNHLGELGVPHEYVVVAGVGHAPMPLLDGLGEEGWFFYGGGDLP